MREREREPRRIRASRPLRGSRRIPGGQFYFIHVQTKLSQRRPRAGRAKEIEPRVHHNHIAGWSFARLTYRFVALAGWLARLAGAAARCGRFANNSIHFSRFVYHRRTWKFETGGAAAAAAARCPKNGRFIFGNKGRRPFGRRDGLL